MFQNGSPPVSFLNGNMSPSTAPPTPDPALQRKQQEEEHATAAYAAYELRRQQEAQAINEAIKSELKKPPPATGAMPQWWHDLRTGTTAQPQTPFKPAAESPPPRDLPPTHQADPFGPSPSPDALGVDQQDKNWWKDADQWTKHWEKEKKKKKWQGHNDRPQNDKSQNNWWHNNGWQSHDWTSKGWVDYTTPVRSPNACKQCGHNMSPKHFYCGKCMTHRETGEKVSFADDRPQAAGDRSRSQSPARRHIVWDSDEEEAATPNTSAAMDVGDNGKDEDDIFKTIFTWQRFSELDLKRNCIFYRSHVPPYVPAATGLPATRRLQHCDDYINSNRPVYENLLIAKENLHLQLDWISKQVAKAEHFAHQAITYKRELEEVVIQQQEDLAEEEARKDPALGLPLPSPKPQSSPVNLETKAVNELLQALHASSSDVATRTLIKKLEAKVNHNAKTVARRTEKRAAAESVDSLDSIIVDDGISASNDVQTAASPSPFDSPIVPVSDNPMPAASPVRLQATEPSGAPPGKRLFRKGNSVEPTMPIGESGSVGGHTDGQFLVLGPRCDPPPSQLPPPPPHPQSPRGSAHVSTSSSSDGTPIKSKSRKDIAAEKRQTRAIYNAAKAQAKEEKRRGVVKASLK